MPEQGLEWAALRFPPVNLWLLAGAAGQNRSQRPGMTARHADALHNFGREQMYRILAMHGGRG
jgi:hypothetical protein